MTKSAAYEQGKEAYFETVGTVGEPVCPYPNGSQERTDWLEGYDAAEDADPFGPDGHEEEEDPTDDEPL